MKSFGKILLVLVGSFIIGVFVTFGIQLLGDLVDWAYEKTPRRMVLFLIVGIVSWYISYLVGHYTGEGAHNKKPRNIFNFWREV